MKYVTSDLHFGHKNILKFCPQTRPYDNVDKMDEDMIQSWNRIVSPEDEVYILGDLSYREPSRTIYILNRLNGTKILVRGNHDEKLLKDKKVRECFSEIHYYLEINFNKTKVVMFHYPIAEWNGMHRGSVHLHGHLHGGKSGLEGYRILDVAFDATGQIVIPLEQAINTALKGKAKSHHESA